MMKGLEEEEGASAYKQEEEVVVMMTMSGRHGLWLWLCGVFSPSTCGTFCCCC